MLARVAAVQAVAGAIGDKRTFREEALTRGRHLAEEGIQRTLQAVRHDRAEEKQKRTADRLLELSGAVAKERRRRSDAIVLLEQRIRCEEEAREVADLAVQRACLGDERQLADRLSELSGAMAEERGLRVDVLACEGGSRAPRGLRDAKDDLVREPEGARTPNPAHWGDLASEMMTPGRPLPDPQRLLSLASATWITPAPAPATWLA